MCRTKAQTDESLAFDRSGAIWDFMSEEGDGEHKSYLNEFTLISLR